MEFDLIVTKGLIVCLFLSVSDSVYKRSHLRYHNTTSLS